MNAVLTDDGKIMLPSELRDNAQLQPGGTLDVQFYKGSIVLRKHQPLTLHWLIRNLSGALDELALFSRALSPAEVRELYDQGRPEF